ncbi:TldD/PmbA family protein [Candidatus Bipolaricaulota bacterium]|nr:TldD/PmbA family protein [Candidatus Bipolaricaulota bacterium]
MNELIRYARQHVDEAEMYWRRAHETTVLYQNRCLQQINLNRLSSVAVRVIDGGRFGQSFGETPERTAIVDEAKTVSMFGDPARHAFSHAHAYNDLPDADRAVSAMTGADLVALCEDTKRAILSHRPDLTLLIRAGTSSERLVIETTDGVHAESETAGLHLAFGAPLQGAGTFIHKSHASSSPFEAPTDLIEEFLTWYGWTEQASTPDTGRLPVIFAPEAAFLYIIPLCFGINGNAVAKETSPIFNRIDESILSEKLTIFDAPDLPASPFSRAFDDEGTACRRRPLVENGILRDFLLDLQSASMLRRRSTGNGFKRQLFGSGTEVAPEPWPCHVQIQPGTEPIDKMITDLDEALLVTGGLGFHSGNYSQGQFAVQAIGFHIRNGRVSGRLESTMISGNIYADLLDIEALSRETRDIPTGMGPAIEAPYVLVESLAVAGR